MPLIDSDFKGFFLFDLHSLLTQSCVYFRFNNIAKSFDIQDDFLYFSQKFNSKNLFSTFSLEYMIFTLGAGQAWSHYRIFRAYSS